MLRITLLMIFECIFQAVCAGVNHDVSSALARRHELFDEFRFDADDIHVKELFYYGVGIHPVIWMINSLPLTEVPRIIVRPKGRLPLA